VSDEHPVYRIRDILERLLPGKLASRILFDALGRVETVPRGDDEVTRFVEGPLAAVLAERRLDADADEIVKQVLRLGRDAAKPANLREASDQSTRAVTTVAHPVVVAVVCCGSSFIDRLGASLGPSRVAPRRLGSLTDLSDFRRNSEGALLVVDATDFPAVDPDELAASVGDFPASVPILIWAADLPYGRSLLRSLGKAKITGLPLPSTEGIDPLLDLIRSRRRR